MNLFYLKLTLLAKWRMVSDARRGKAREEAYFYTMTSAQGSRNAADGAICHFASSARRHIYHEAMVLYGSHALASFSIFSWSGKSRILK